MCGGGGRWPPPPSCGITIRPHHGFCTRHAPVCSRGGRCPPPPSCDITIRPHHEVSVLATLPCVVVAAGGPRRRHAKSPFGPATRFLYSPRSRTRSETRQATGRVYWMQRRARSRVPPRALSRPARRTVRRNVQSRPAPRLQHRLERFQCLLLRSRILQSGRWLAVTDCPLERSGQPLLLV